MQPPPQLLLCAGRYTVQVDYTLPAGYTYLKLDYINQAGPAGLLGLL